MIQSEEFPYALWRDLVSDPTPVGGAMTSGDVGPVQGPPRRLAFTLWITSLWRTLPLVGGLRR